MKKLWHDDAWDEYVDWMTKDRKVIKIENNCLIIIQCGNHYEDH